MLDRFAIALLALIFVSCRSEGATEAAPAPEPGQSASARAADVAAPPTVVFLGDSLTAGLGLAESEALPALIQQEIERAGTGHRVINAGRSGDTTAGGLSRIDWYLRDSVNIAALVIGLGSNDAMRGLPLESIEENLVALARRARARDPELPILLWEMKTFPNMGQSYGDAYTAVFRRVADAERLVLIDFPLADVAGIPELNQPDGIHPTAEGTRKVAARIWAALEPVLKRER